MADIFKRVTVSEDIVYLGKMPEPLSDPSEPRPSGSGALSQFPLPDGRGSEAELEDAFQRGFAAGSKCAHEQTNALTNTLNTLIQNLPQVISEHRMELSSEIADIVFTFARQFFINQQQSKDAIRNQVTQMITQMNDKQTINVFLHPKDLGLINVDLNQFQHVRLIPDESLRLGGCIVKSEHGMFDASIERQIDSLKQVLLQMRGRDE